MNSRKTLTLALALLAGTGAAHADTIFTVDASYDPFITADTTITIQNVSGATETASICSPAAYSTSSGTWRRARASATSSTMHRSFHQRRCQHRPCRIRPPTR